MGLGFAWCEWKTWRASREDLPAGGEDPGRVQTGEAVLVLGNPFPVLQRWRVRIAVRSTDPSRARFIFSGAVTRGSLSEARMMADYAVEVLGVPASNVLLEEQAQTTVENVANSIPLMDDAPAIKIASSIFHARRARRILGDQSPDLATRLVRTRDYIPGEWGPLHVLLVALQMYRNRRARSTTVETRPDSPL
jgi:uncharacterized SAM-binding protein YcdF (DUF218 family)